MRFFTALVFIFLSFCSRAQVENAVPGPPRPPRLYNDFTNGKNFLTPSQAEALEQKLSAYADSTSNEVAIVIVESLKGYEVNEYATALGRKWGVGGAQFNNGVVVLVSTGGGEGNRDAYIAPGYGLEGAIPDITAKRIVENELIPYLKEGKGSYYRGLDHTVDAIIKAAAGEYKATGKKKSKGISGFRIFVLIMVFWIVLGIFSRGGRGGGGMMSRRGYRGWWGPTWSGGGWSGGGWSGGSSGGGFGGFGGGSFGGGGAGGKW
jgi:uncharacterized protein